MKLWRKRDKSSAATASLRHHFVIGPQRYNELFGEPARIYHCVRCKWTFLVGAGEVVVLDEHQQPIAGEEGLKRFDSLAEGPCPVLEAFMSAALSSTQAARAARRNGLPQPEPERKAPVSIPAPTAHPRPVLRLLGRMRPHFVR